MRSESQESVESQRETKKKKLDRSYVQRKSNIFILKIAANTFKRKNKVNDNFDNSLLSQSNLMNESNFSEIHIKKNVFSDKIKLKNISDNFLDSNEDIITKKDVNNKNLFIFYILCFNN